MKLQNIPRATETAEIGSQPDLVSSVTRLVDCLKQAAAHQDGVGTAGHRRVIADALGAAVESELGMAEQRQRIAFLERLAMSDGLTGLLNRRSFRAELHRTLAAARRYGEKGVLVYVDLDGFKPINDTHGHAAGDAVLRHVARVLGENVRDTDYVARLGGDEFAVMLTRTTWEDGLKRAEALDRVVNGASIPWDGGVITIHASFGIQTYGPSDDGERLLERADEAMYRAKRLRAEVHGK